MKLLALIFVCVIGKYSFSQTKIEKTFYWNSFVFPILVNDNNFIKFIYTMQMVFHFSMIQVKNLTLYF